MKWYRSYLKDLETTLACADQDGRSFVYDPGHCEPYYAEDTFGYWGLFTRATEDFCLIEWDIAISFEDRKRFENYCYEKPDTIHVAPYRHYNFRNVYHDYDYMHRTGWMNFVQPGDPYCFYFGFGLIYFPIEIIQQYVRDARDGIEILSERRGHPYNLHTGGPRAGSTFDALFSDWHTTITNMQPVPVHWDVRPIHLNYDSLTPSERMIEHHDASSLS